MSLQHIANQMASQGRGKDSTLVHMSPREVAGLQALAQQHGGSLSINPSTGLPEAGFLESLLPAIAGFALGPAGFGVMSALGAAGTVAGLTALTSKDLGKGLMAGLGAYGGANLGEAFMGAGETALGGPAVQAASQAGPITGAAADAVRSNALSGVSNFDKVSAGFGAATQSPQALMNFAGNNGRNMLAAAGPVLADQSIQTTTPMPSRQGRITPFVSTRTQLPYDPNLPASAEQDYFNNSVQALPPVRAGFAGGGSVDPGDSMGPMPQYRMPAYSPTPVYGMPMPIPGQMPGDRGGYPDGQVRIPEYDINMPGFEYTPPKPPGAGRYNAPKQTYPGRPITTMPVKPPLPPTSGMTGDSLAAYNYLMGITNTTPKAAPARTTVKALPPKDPAVGEGHYEYDPAGKRYKWIPDAVKTDTDTEVVRGGGGDRGVSGGVSGQGFTGSTTDGSASTGVASAANSAAATLGNMGFTGLSNALASQVNPNYGNEGRNAAIAVPAANPMGVDPAQAAQAATGVPGIIGLATPTTSYYGNDNDSGAFSDAGPSPGSSAPGAVGGYGGNAQAGAAAAAGTVGGYGPGTPGFNGGMVGGIPSGSGISADGGGDAAGGGGGGRGEGGGAATGGRGGDASGGGDRGTRGGFADGGIMALASGGMGNLGGYSDGGRLLRGPGDGVSDSIPATIGKGQPARLADGEFVVPARIVSELGNGSTEAGAKQLYAMMARIQAGRAKTTGKNKVATNSKAARHLPA